VEEEPARFVILSCTSGFAHSSSSHLTLLTSCSSSSGWLQEAMKSMKRLQDEVLNLREHKETIHQLIEENTELRREISNKMDNINMLTDTIEQRNLELLTLSRLLEEKDKQLTTLRSATLSSSSSSSFLPNHSSSLPVLPPTQQLQQPA
jgi:predicted RNase H-like nuclease (RuvC/YqgF family)